MTKEEAEKIVNRQLGIIEKANRIITQTRTRYLLDNIKVSVNGRPRLAINYAQVEEAAASCKTHLAMAKYLGMHRGSFNRYNIEDPKFINALRKGKIRNPHLSDQLADKLLAATPMPTANAVLTVTSERWNVRDEMMLRRWRAKVEYDRQQQKKTIGRPRINPKLHGIKAPFSTHYPYVTGHNQDALVNIISNIVSKNLADEMRADVCQEMLLAVLEGKLDIAEAQEAYPIYLKSYRKIFSTKNYVSLDAPVYGKDGNGKRTLADTLEG